MTMNSARSTTSPTTLGAAVPQPYATVQRVVRVGGADRSRRTRSVDDAFPCAADMPGAEDMPMPGYHDDRRWGLSGELLGFTLPRRHITHLDSPATSSGTARCTTGVPLDLVDAATGLAGRAVTAAAERDRHAWRPARHRDDPRCDWLEPGQAVFPDGSRRRPSVDRVCGSSRAMRYSCVPATAGIATRPECLDDTAYMTQAGWHASCLPWLHEREVALIGADTPQDVEPTGYDDVLMPVHTVASSRWVCGCSTTATWKLRDDDRRARPVGLPSRSRAGPLRRHVRQPGQPDRHILTTGEQEQRCSIPAS